MKRFGLNLFRTVVIAAFALWFGGFTFYVSFVVPVGTEVLGSARAQGFITQQVTNWLNVVCGFGLLLMSIESLRGVVATPVQRSWTEIVAILLMGGFLMALIWIHVIMDGMIDISEKSVANKRRFYGIHRIYLWISTLQWIVGWVWLFFAVARWKQEAHQIEKVSSSC